VRIIHQCSNSIGRQSFILHCIALVQFFRVQESFKLLDAINKYRCNANLNLRNSRQMCGIFAVFGYLQGDMENFRPKAISLTKRYVLFVVYIIYTKLKQITPPRTRLVRNSHSQKQYFVSRAFGHCGSGLGCPAVDQ
jgi:hypothetical protein